MELKHRDDISAKPQLIVSKEVMDWALSFDNREPINEVQVKRDPVLFKQEVKKMLDKIETSIADYNIKNTVNGI